MEQIDIFDFMPDGKKFKPIESTDWKWSFADYPKEKNGLKVFSCFACGGGSTMGYKLAGCDVIGCCEIDPKMNEIYIKNHHPKHNFLMDIRSFNEIPNDELPPELFNLDILDGSPPCTTFSMAGEREESWGKKKKFREGQAEQTLDDLSFVFIDTVAKLKPKVMVMENVEGLIKGEAWTYVQKIYKQLHDIGYKVKHWLCKGEHMGIPQTRHRVFFVAVRKDSDFDIEMIDMAFNYKPITYSEIKDGEHIESSMEKAKIAKKSIKGEASLCETMQRLCGRTTYFSEKIIYKNEVCKTLTAGGGELWLENTGTHINDQEMINISTFPQDYDFGGEKVKYVCGMSVPPVMIKRIVTRLIESGVFDAKLRK
jgi:DNA (cytosine-5)-methyltransferase 1